MRKVTLLMMVLLTLALAVVTTIPAAEAAKGGGTPGCFWTCDCTGSPVCTCPPGTTGFCVYPPNIGCPQIYTC